VTGNTSLDALKLTAGDNYAFIDERLSAVDFDKYRVITLEAHRRENLGAPLVEIIRAVKHILDIYQDMYVVFPIHLNPDVQEPVRRMLSGHNRTLLLDPLCLPDYHNLIKRSFLLLTDSGGLQEEGPSLGTPVLVLRAETERQEAVDAGTVRLVGAVFDNIVSEVRRLTDDPEAYGKMTGAKNPYGDGTASLKILDAIASRFGLNGGTHDA
jgi:UDP-N-acetylglucosamine 2-epimerase